MNPRNGLHLLPPRDPQPAALQVAQPMNDTQLVALVAAQLASGYDFATNALVAERAVALAVEIVARSFARVAGGAFQARIRAAVADEQTDPAA